MSELKALRAERIALVSPYPSAIMLAAVKWWTLQGFEVVQQGGVDIHSTDTVQIYQLQSADAWRVNDKLEEITGTPKCCEALRMIGRLGMPVPDNTTASALPMSILLNERQASADCN